MYPNKQPDSGSYHVMRASDENENTWWGAYIGGNEIVASVTNMDFHQGLGIASSERGNANDSAFAAFADLREHHTSNGWTPWEMSASSPTAATPIRTTTLNAWATTSFGWCMTDAHTT